MSNSSCLLVASVFSLITTALSAQSTVRVSVDAVGNELPGGAIWGAISGNGRFAAFVAADGTLPGDNNGHTDVFVRDLRNGQLRRVSVTATGVQPNDQCFQPKLSDDGRFVAFSSWADNLAGSDINGSGTDIFVKDMVTGALEHVSVNSAGVGGDGISAYHDLSGDGRFVSYYSYSVNLVANDTNGSSDTFVFDRQTGIVECLSLDPVSGVPAVGGEASLSTDGRFAVFATLSPLAGSLGGTVWFDRQTGQAQLVATMAGGIAAPVYSAKISGDGSKVLFDTTIPLLAGDNDFVRDAYLLDVTTGSLELISAPPAIGLAAPCFGNALSQDGRFVVFSTVDAFDAADTNQIADSYVLDRASGALSLAMLSNTGQLADDIAVVSDMSNDGRYLVSTSRAANLDGLDLNFVNDVFVRDRCLAATWSYYGVGLSGSGGVEPGIALVGEPAIGTTPLVALQNATGGPTLAALALGTAIDSIATPFGGLLLVGQPIAVTLLVPTPGLLQPIAIPNLVDLCGVHVYLQALVVDAAAPVGIAFTRGIDVTIGG